MPGFQHPRFARLALGGFLILWLALLIGVTVLLAVGGRPTPQDLGQTLDGAWRFHAGDDLRWAAPGAKDDDWDRITLVSRPEVHDGDVGIPGYLDGWEARGHPKLEGYGWYRRQVTLPPRGDLVLVAPLAVDDGYEVYWNGRRVGGVGRLTGAPRVSASRPLLIRLPDAGGERTAVLAIRAYMQPGFGRDGKSGGLRTAPVLASRAEGEALYRAQWSRWIAGYVADAAEPLAMLALALLAVVLAPALARPTFARWAALALVASGGLRLGNPIAVWTDLDSVPGLVWRNGVVLAPLTLLFWTIAWNQWTDGRDRRPVSLAAVAAWAAMVLAALTKIHVLEDLGRSLFAALLAVIAIRIVRRRDQAPLALAAMVFVAVALFAAALSKFGVPGIWFPFGIGVSRSQYAYAVALPLVAYAIFAAKPTART